MKKEELTIENEKLKQELDNLDAKDLQIRKELSELLDSYHYVQEYGYSKQEKKVDVCSWYKIAYLIGELKADADYSCVLSAKEDFRRENEQLRQEVKDLKNPPPPLT